MQTPTTIRRPSLSRAATSLFGTLVVFVLAGCSSSDREPLPRFVLITIDTLRADRLHCYGYERETSPNIDRLASQGALFTNAQVPRSSTWPSLTTILTGKYPITHGVRKNGEQLSENHLYLSQLFEEIGYRTAGFTTNMIRAPYRGFDTLERFPDGKGTQAERDRMATDAAIDWLRENGDERFFLWVHYIDPHKPYAPEPAFDRFTDPDFVFEIPDDFDRPEKSGMKIHRDSNELDEYLQYAMGRGIELSETQVAHVNALYDGEILAVDHEVGRLLDALDGLGLERDTLVILVSDHGEELNDHHGYFYHVASVYQGVLHVPLLVRLPGRIPPASRHDDVVEAVDIAPTAFDLLGLEDPGEGFQGESLGPLLLGEGTRSGDVAFAEWAEEIYLRTPEGELRHPIYIVRRGKWKYIHNPDGVHPSVPPFEDYGTAFPIDRAELYDLDRDPRETQNLLEMHPDVAESLRGYVGLYAQHRTGRSTGFTVQALVETVKMGYVGAESAARLAQEELGMSREEFLELLNAPAPAGGSEGSD